MELLKLRLGNFKGVKSFALDIQGKDADVFGDMGTGKTTIYDAMTWLLYDKDSIGAAEFSLKTLTPDSEPIHGLDHEVEGVFQVEGRELTLKKVYAEKWTKKRGSANAVFTGHTTEYFIDDVPTTKGKYDARITEIADEQTFRLLTDPEYFSKKLPWRERRRLLLEVCGIVMTDADVIASDSKLARLPEILNGRKQDDYKKIIATRRTKINEEVEKIPVRIDEVEKGLPDTAGLDETSLKAKIERLGTKKKAKEEEAARIKAGGETAEKAKRLSEIETELLSIERKAHEAADQLNRAAKAEALAIVDQIDIVDQQIRSKRREIENLAGELTRKEAHLIDLRSEWHKVNDQAFEFKQDETCPTCGQALPAERLQEAREKALAAFNMTKANRLSSISEEGTTGKAAVEKLNTEIERLTKELAPLEGQKEKLKAIPAPTPSNAPDISNDPVYRGLEFEEEVLQAEIESLRNSNAPALALASGEITVLGEAIKAAQDDLGKLEQRDRGQVRIEELKDEERMLAAEYERLEGELFLIDLFIKTKVTLLENKINSRFKSARFKMFDAQINGGLEECCEVLCGGVPYSSGLNTGARKNVGLEILNALSEYLDFVAPIFIDDANLITRFTSTRAQTIRLVVSEPDKVLRVECKSKSKKEAVLA
jgi:hypothetical protein